MVGVTERASLIKLQISIYIIVQVIFSLKVFELKFCKHTLQSPRRATRTAYHILLYLVILLTFCEKYKLLCNLSVLLFSPSLTVPKHFVLEFSISVFLSSEI
jgi:hypothetical protein